MGIKKMTKEIIDEMFEVLSSNIKIINSNIEITEKDYLTWKSNILSNKKLRTIIIKDNILRGYLQYIIIDNEVWICEIQIRDDNKHDKVTLKRLLSQLIKESNIGKEIIIYGNINPINKHSIDVFTHIGFINKENNKYEINGYKLIKYIDN